MLIDAAAHVWSPDAARYPWAPWDDVAPPRAAAPAEALLADLGDVSGEGAVCIQPRAYGADHSYLADVVAAHPAELVGVGLVDPRGTDAAHQVRHLVRQVGLRGIRIVAAAGGAGEWLATPRGDPAFREAARLQVPVDLLVRPDQLRAVAERATRSSDTTIVIDHLGLLAAPVGADDLEALLRCAEHDNVVVKVSAFGALSAQPYPHRDLVPMVQRVIDRFGPSRLVFGTDWPHCLRHGRYRNSVDVLRSIPGLHHSDVDQILRGTARALWWGERR